MRQLFITVSLVIAVSPAVVTAGEVVKGEDGMYWKRYESVGSNTFVYQVDQITQQCFAAFTNSGGLTNIPCNLLARRAEWEPIINWVAESQ